MACDCENERVPWPGTKLNKFDMTLLVTETVISISIEVNGDKGMINCAGLHFVVQYMVHYTAQTTSKGQWPI